MRAALFKITFHKVSYASKKKKKPSMIIEIFDIFTGKTVASSLRWLLSI